MSRPCCRAVASLEFGDFRRAFWRLADDRREALILIGASGLSYEEAAKVCDCPKGTINSGYRAHVASYCKFWRIGCWLTGGDPPAMAGYVGGLLDGPAASGARAQRGGRSTQSFVELMA